MCYARRLVHISGKIMNLIRGAKQIRYLEINVAKSDHSIFDALRQGESFVALHWTDAEGNPLAYAVNYPDADGNVHLRYACAKVFETTERWAKAGRTHIVYFTSCAMTFKKDPQLNKVSISIWHAEWANILFEAESQNSRRGPLKTFF